MKALSIKQPWAWLICAGYKNIENRNWYLHMPPLLDYPGYAKNVPMRIYVHSGKKYDVEGADFLLSQIRRRFPALYQNKTDLDTFLDVEYRSELFGAIIGEVDITGCVDESDSPWFVGPYGFTLANSVLYGKPVPYKGRLGFFE